MAKTRKHEMSTTLPVDTQRAFKLLITPSDLRGWWGASRAIVLPQKGGIWAAVWGEHEDEPEYVTVARIKIFEPGQRLLLDDYRYMSRESELPFEADFSTDFQLSSVEGGCSLTVVQDGFPADEIADKFYKACEVGWQQTLESMRRYVSDGGRGGNVSSD